MPIVPPVMTEELDLRSIMPFLSADCQLNFNDFKIFAKDFILCDDKSIKPQFSHRTVRIRVPVPSCPGSGGNGKGKSRIFLHQQEFPLRLRGSDRHSPKTVTFSA